MLPSIEMKCAVADLMVVCNLTSSPGGDCRAETMTFYNFNDKNWKKLKPLKLQMFSNVLNVFETLLLLAFFVTDSHSQSRRKKTSDCQTLEIIINQGVDYISHIF